ncbi:MAG: nuclear transport factor 2 family protein [Polyangiales bacterium]
MSAADNKQRVLAAFDALSAGDRRPFWDAVADDATWTAIGSNSWSGTFEGKQRIGDELFGPLIKVLGKPPRTLVKRVFADEDTVIVEARGDNVTTAGKRYENTYCLLLRFADGKIRAITEYMDTELATQVLGVRPAV